QGHVTSDLPAKGFLLVIADGDEGDSRRVYYYVRGAADGFAAPEREFFSTHFKLNADHDGATKPFNRFALAASSPQEVLDRVVLDFTKTPYKSDQSAGRFETEGTAPD